MFFEGSEKKANIIVDSKQLNLLRDLDNGFWNDFVSCGQAEIISLMEREKCKAFILSESSLFIWENRLLIITCGITQLVKSVEYFLDSFGREAIEQVLYQRKNEYFAKAQLTTFGDDLKTLNKLVKGTAYRFGELHSHHNYLFEQNSTIQLPSHYCSYEFIAYQIDEAISQKLTSNALTAEEIRKLLNIGILIPDFEISDHVFSPFGYSLNAIKQNQYITIHVTPQSGSSYVSFESNINLIELAPIIIKTLNPASFDLLCVNERNFKNQSTEHIPSSYLAKSLVSGTLNNGGLVNFSEHIKLNSPETKPLTLDLNSHATSL